MKNTNRWVTFRHESTLKLLANTSEYQKLTVYVIIQVPSDDRLLAGKSERSSNLWGSEGPNEEFWAISPGGREDLSLCHPVQNNLHHNITELVKYSFALMLFEYNRSI